MPDYQKLYTLLFNAVTDTLEDLDRLNISAAKARLVAVQQQAEEMYIEAADDGLRHKWTQRERASYPEARFFWTKIKNVFVFSAHSGAL